MFFKRFLGGLFCMNAKNKLGKYEGKYNILVLSQS